MKYLMYGLLLTGQFILSTTLHAATIESAATGDWATGTTWVGGIAPLATDDVIIKDNHVVTISGIAYTHTGDLFVETDGELVLDCGNTTDGFIFSGGTFHLFGTLTSTFSPAKDFEVAGNSFFWGHPSAVVFISDDWKISGNSQSVVEGICVEVDDDFILDGANATLCGGGAVSIGISSGSNTYDLNNGATNAQVCQETGVYRGAGGGACGTLIQFGSGNQNILAINDSETTNVDVPITIDVIDSPTLNPDSDPDVGDVINLISTGVGYTNDNTTKEGGTVTINDNGTPGIFTDDYIDYTPSLGFQGLDEFIYIITDNNGSYDWALVTVDVQAPLPIELYSFNISNIACNTELDWVTASETDNDYYDIERSSDGVNFEVIGQISGAGTSSTFRTYKYVDRFPLRGENYYRVKQVDFSGDFSFTRTLQSSAPCDDLQQKYGITEAFPNPIGAGTLTVLFESAEELTETIVVANIFGQVVAKFQQDFAGGRNNITINIDDLDTGMYVIAIGRHTTKFQKSES